MKLEKALSLDTGEFLTPAEADSLFQAGLITSKSNFKCPDENCEAAVTCANLDKLEKARVLAPYFKVMGVHSDKCLIMKDVVEKQRNARQRDTSSGKRIPFSKVYRLNFQPPSTTKFLNAQTFGYQDATSSTIKVGGASSDGANTFTRTIQLSSVVSKFRKGESIELEIPNMGSIHIRDLFIKIDGQDISDLPNEWRIYHGEAWFNKKETGYSIVFCKKLKSGNTTDRPSFFISNEKLDNSGYAKFNQKNMASNANTHPKQVFVLTEFAPFLEKGQYINIRCAEPHYVDYIKPTKKGFKP